ncbi:TPR repeat region-containing protein [Nocardia camponoti]|uniref:TPR repeat domain-containing protein n=1 Tax=Nocardia camponoti TaxID=1616106 RepID=A0A917QBH7_9NOCA|nr:hypothetical protein [Nocardia camponoti]GGK40638.1 hypothetical protein GCM10011591_10280 [Nocardia camponoti]
MPSRSQVDAWNTAKLSEWATAIDTNVAAYEAKLGTITGQFANAQWTGKAKDAAADRFTEEDTQGRYLSIEIRDIAAALRAADTRLANERRILLGRVADAEHDAESPIRLKVDEKWAVSADGTVSDDEARQKVVERLNHHQGLINTAYYSMMTAASEAATAISTAAQEVRVRGDQFGSGVDATDDDFSRSGLLGEEDGKRVRDAGDKYGKIDNAILDEVASHLPVGVLTDEQLTALAAGGEVSTLPASVQDYYREFYKAAGTDGVIALSERLKEQELAGNVTAAGRRDSLANGLMVLSNEKIGTGRNPDGSLQSPGSYQNLPKEIRDVISTRVTGPGGDGNALGYPQVSDWNKAVFLADSAKLSDLIGEANPGYTPGTEFGREMIRQASTLGQLDPDNPALESTMRDYVEAGARNHTSMTQLLTGHTEPGEVPLDKDYDPNKVMKPLLQYDWSDSKPDGSAPEMFSWIGKDAIPVPGTDGNPGVTVDESKLAGRAAQGLTELMTGKGNFESYMNIGSQDDKSLGQVNPGLTQQITKSMVPYLDSIAKAPEIPTSGDILGRGDNRDLKAIRLSALLNSDPDSGVIWNTALNDKTNQYAAQFGYLDDKSENRQIGYADAAARLLGYQDQGIKAEAYDRGLSDTEAKKEAAEKKTLALGIGTSILSESVGRVPGAGAAVDIASQLIEQGIEPEKGKLPEAYYRVDPDTAASQRYYSMLQGLARSDPDFFTNPPSGAGPLPAAWLHDGKLASFQEILDSGPRSADEFSWASRKWLDATGVNYVNFTNEQAQKNIHLDDYTIDPGEYEDKVLRG